MKKPPQKTSALALSWQHVYYDVKHLTCVGVAGPGDISPALTPILCCCIAIAAMFILAIFICGLMLIFIAFACMAATINNILLAKKSHASNHKGINCKLFNSQYNFKILYTVDQERILNTYREETFLALQHSVALSVVG